MSLTAVINLCGCHCNLQLGYILKKKMNDLFRALFGIPPNDQQGERLGERPPQDYRNSYIRNSGDDDDDDDEDNGVNMRNGPRGGIFGFPMFNDPGDIHKQFERLFDEMNKAFGVFGFGGGPSITWESNGSTFLNEEPQQRHEGSLRDAYLKKPDCSCDKISQKDNFNLGSNINPYEQGTSNNTVQNSYPKFFSKSVFIQTIRRPDGSVETIKKVRDHEGNEETTISQSNMNEPLPPPGDLQGDPLAPAEDVSGISFLKKFFPF